MSRQACTDVFSTPELVNLIHTHLAQCESARLACTCHQFFQTFMPSLWECVDGVSQVLALLPGLDDANESAVLTQIRENDFARFNVYASWIKHLEICKDGEFSLSKSQSGILRQYTATLILLPNLESITSSNSRGDADILWVLPFLSASVLALEFIIANPLQHPNISIPESSIILRTISRKCPNLRKLAIFTEWDRWTDSYTLEYASSGSEPLDENQLERLHPFLADIRPLVSLACSDELLIDPACFLTISSWPSLERLEITIDQTKDEYLFPAIPRTAFPSLKHLALYWLTSEAFDMFWNVETVFSKLISVKLLLSSYLCTSQEDFSDVLFPVLSSLVELCPHMQSVWIRAVGSDGMNAQYEVPVSTISDLQRRPLQALYMEGIKLVPRNVDDDDENYDEDDEEGLETLGIAERLATMFPALRELAFPNQTLPLADLETFHSSMPHLEILRFDFELKTLPMNLGVDLNAIGRYRISPFHTLEANFLALGEWDRIAGITRLSYHEVVWLVRYLFSLWPNVRIAARPDEENLKRLYWKHKRLIALINDHLAALSCCNEDWAMKYEDIRVLNEDSWKQCFNTA